LVQQILDGRKSLCDPPIIGDRAVLKGDVEVTANENTMVLDRQIFEGTHLLSLQSSQSQKGDLRMIRRSP
jgi:hypothetical protein